LPCRIISAKERQAIDYYFTLSVVSCRVEIYSSPSSKEKRIGAAPFRHHGHLKYYSWRTWIEFWYDSDIYFLKMTRSRVIAVVHPKKLLLSRPLKVRSGKEAASLIPTPAIPLHVPRPRRRETRTSLRSHTQSQKCLPERLPLMPLQILATRSCPDLSPGGWRRWYSPRPV